MMKYITAVYILILLLTVSVLPSCTPGSCQEETLSLAKAGFYKTGTGKPVTADSITLYGLGKESSSIYKKALKLQTISFPLDANSDTSIFVLRINGNNDTVTFVYTSYPHMISKECGYTFFHVLDTVWNTRSGIDFLVKNQNITTYNDENIRIYY